MRRILVVMLVAGVWLTPAAQAQDSGTADDPAVVLVSNAVIPEDLRLDTKTVPGGRKTLVCLALNDYWEARGETKAGRVAVAKVVLNRVRDARYPSDVCDVVTENRTSQENACQFSWHCDGRPDTPAEDMAWHESLLLAAAVLYSGDAIDDPSDGALWYHATSVEPAWSAQLEVARRIGNHVFYRDPSGPQPDDRGMKLLASFRALGPITTAPPAQAANDDAPQVAANDDAGPDTTAADDEAEEAAVADPAGEASDAPRQLASASPF